MTSSPSEGTQRLLSIRNLITQEGRSFTFDSCPEGTSNAQWTDGNATDYMTRMQGNIAQGMVMDISLWGQCEINLLFFTENLLGNTAGVPRPPPH